MIKSLIELLQEELSRAVSCRGARRRLVTPLLTALLTAPLTAPLTALLTAPLTALLTAPLTAARCRGWSVVRPIVGLKWRCCPVPVRLCSLGLIGAGGLI